MRIDRRNFILLAGGLHGATSNISQIDLWTQGDRGVHTYRIPALVETKKGTLIAIVDARHDSNRDLPGRISLVMRRSLDGGRTWQDSVTIRTVSEGGVGDPSLLVDRSNARIWCFHAFCPQSKPMGARVLEVHVITSDDDGLTWSAPRDLTPQLKDPSWMEMFLTSGTHVQTRRGRFLVPAAVRDATNQLTARNAYSDDHGKTWKSGPAIGPGTDESHFVELKDGTILQNMRSNGKRRAIARSTDGGVNFNGFTHDEALIDPSCNAGITTWGRLLVFTNAASTKREKLTMKISKDAGRTWSTGRVLHEGPAAYSTVIPLRGGGLGVLYERGERYAAERITFARIEKDWLS